MSGTITYWAVSFSNLVHKCEVNCLSLLPLPWKSFEVSEAKRRSSKNRRAMESNNRSVQENKTRTFASSWRYGVDYYALRSRFFQWANYFFEKTRQISSEFISNVVTLDRFFWVKFHIPLCSCFQTKTSLIWNFRPIKVIAHNVWTILFFSLQ